MTAPSRSRRVRLLLLTTVAGAAASATAPSVSASPVFELVGGVGGEGGLNARAVGASPSAAYFNPALLAKAKRQLEFGMFMLSDQIEMILDGRPGGDVPLLVGDRNAFDPDTGVPISNDTMPTDWLEEGGKDGMPASPRQGSGSSGNSRGYAVLGLVAPIIEDKLALGLQTIIPIGTFTSTNAFYNDEREQFFSNSLHAELYSDRLTAMSLAFGLGGALTDAISVGAGMTVNLKNSAEAATYVRDPADYDQLRLSTAVNVNTSIAPHFGITLEPNEGLALSATFHSEQQFVVETQFGATLPDGKQSDTSRLSVHNFVPMSAGLGADYVFNPKSENQFGIVATVVFENWATYLDRHGEQPDQYGDEFAWKDTFSGGIGVRYEGETKARLDLAYHPSPVPAQVGRSNYVDNDRLSMAFGINRAFAISDGVSLAPGAQLQVHRLLPRHQSKDDDLIRDEFPDGSVDDNLVPIPSSEGLQTNNPGWPGFQSQGWILGGGVTVSLFY